MSDRRLQTVVASLLLAVVARAEAPWEFEYEQDAMSLKVWKRDRADGSGRELKAEALFDVPVERIWEVLGDTDHFVEFMPYLKEMRILEQGGKIHFEYERIAPPIVSERDYTVKVTRTVDAKAGVWRHAWQLANDRGPPPIEGVVRLTVNEGSWQFRREGTGTRVTYLLFTHPGGSIPTWLASKGSSSSIPDLMTAVLSRAKDPAWKR